MNSSRKYPAKFNFSNAYLFLIVGVALLIGLIVLLRSQAAVVDVKAQMLSALPGTQGEDIPWGKQVNSNFPEYSWYDSAQNSSEMDLTGNGGAYTRINWWGAIFRGDSNNNSPANTRVELANCSLWILFKNATAWEKTTWPRTWRRYFSARLCKWQPGAFGSD